MNVPPAYLAPGITEAPAPRTDTAAISFSAGKTAREHFYWIDWLRFLAAVAVMVEHIRYHINLDWIAEHESPGSFWHYLLFLPTRLGRESVILFFVISGFLVGGRALRRVAAGTFDLRAYAFDRATRVYVPLLPALVLTAATSAAAGSPVSPYVYVYHLAALQGVCVSPLHFNGSLWTLTYETWFYVLAGAVATLAAPGARGKGIAFGLAVFALGLFMPLEPVFLFCWVLGAFAYGIIEAVRERRPALGWMAAAWSAAACAGYQVANDVVPVDPAWKERVPTVEMCELLLALGFAVLVACLSGAAPRARFARRIEQAGTRLAAFSYTLYLVHYPVLFYLKSCWPHLGGDAAGRFTVRLVLCTAVSAGMYALFEAHTARVRRWLQGRWEKR